MGARHGREIDYVAVPATTGSRSACAILAPNMKDALGSRHIRKYCQDGQRERNPADE